MGAAEETGLYVDCATGRTEVRAAPADILAAVAKATKTKTRWEAEQAAQRAADLAVVTARAGEDPAFAALARLVGVAVA